MYSCPGVKFLLKGMPPRMEAGGLGYIISRSVAQIATASMRTSTSAFFGTGTGFSRNESSPGLPSTHAFMVSGTWNSLSTFTPGGAYMGVFLELHQHRRRTRVISRLGTRFSGGRHPGGQLYRRAIAYEQAVPQTEAAKRYYAGGSCGGGTGDPANPPSFGIHGV